MADLSHPHDSSPPPPEGATLSISPSTRELLGRLTESISVRRSFGVAYERNGITIIPVAFVAGGGGGGTGPAKQPSPLGSGTEDKPPMGTGGGFGNIVIPMGAYVVKGDQVRWVPSFDATLITLAAFGVLRAFISLFKRRRHG